MKAALLLGLGSTIQLLRRKMNRRVSQRRLTKCVIALGFLHFDSVGLVAEGVTRAKLRASPYNCFCLAARIATFRTEMRAQALCVISASS
jgi:hypothetical protein